MNIFEAIQARDAAAAASVLTAEPAQALARDKNNVSALMTAIYYRQPQIAALLVEKRRAQGSELDIFEAAAQGDVARLHVLLGKDKALVASISSDGWTALHLAAAFDGPEAVRALLQHGAQVNALSTNPMSNMPLHAACSISHRKEVLEPLLESGAEINARQHGGYTPLHSAAANGNLEFIKLLLAHGADAAITCDSGETPLQVAEKQKKADAVALLRKSA